MSKQGIIGRVTQLARADVSAIVGSAADPQQALDQLRRDYAATVAEAEEAIAQLIANLRITESDQHDDATAAAQWGQEAESVSQKADLLRASGAATDAHRLDNLAMVALERQLIAETDIDASRHTAAAQRESIARLTDGVDRLTVKLAELRRADDIMATRSRAAANHRPGGRQPAHGGPLATTDAIDPASELARFEDKVRQEEARSHGAEPLPASPFDAQFGRLDNAEHRPEIEERLQALKADRAMAAAKAKIDALEHDQPFR